MVNLSVNRDLNVVTIVIRYLSLVEILLLCLHFALVNLNTTFLHGYPILGKGLPGPFVSQRYSVTYIVYALATLRYLVPIASLFMILNRRVIWRRDLHYIVTKFVVLLDVFILIMVFIWTCTCNGAIFPNNPCNDKKFCCVNFAKHPGLCPNSIGCTPAVTELDLTWNTTFMLAALFHVLFFFIDFLQIVMNRFYRKYVTAALTFEDPDEVAADANQLYDALGWNGACPSCDTGTVRPTSKRVSGKEIGARMSSPPIPVKYACDNCTYNGANDANSAKQIWSQLGWQKRCDEDDCGKLMNPSHVGALYQGNPNSRLPTERTYHGVMLRCSGCNLYHNNRHQKFVFRESHSYMKE